MHRRDAGGRLLGRTAAEKPFSSSHRTSLGKYLTCRAADELMSGVLVSRERPPPPELLR